MKKGIFWRKDRDPENPQLITVSVECDENGKTPRDGYFSSKSGENFNHKAEWRRLPKSVTEGRPFDYYPRGRVEIKNGEAKIYLNPDLCTESILGGIVLEFELSDIPVEIKADGSAHYRYHCK